MKRTDYFVLIAIILAAIPITVLAQVNFLTSTILFFGLPSAYLIWRRPQNFKKAFFAAVVLGLILGFSFDFVAEFNSAWGWASNTSLALPVELFGVVSLDILLWYFLWVFMIVAYYEYFVEHDRNTKISPHARWVVFVGLGIAATVIAVWKIAPEVLTLTYAYAKLGTIILVLCAVLFIKNPRLIYKVIRLLPFFVFTYLAYELTALYSDLWSFPGAYVGLVSIGDLIFPLEELVVWVVASSAIVATYYEFCIDDGK